MLSTSPVHSGAKRLLAIPEPAPAVGASAARLQQFQQPPWLQRSVLRARKSTTQQFLQRPLVERAAIRKYADDMISKKRQEGLNRIEFVRGECEDKANEKGPAFS